MMFLTRWEVDERVAHFLGLPFDGSGVPHELSRLRHDFVRGLIGGALILMALPLVALASSSEWRRWIMFFAFLWQGPQLADGALIFLTCSNLADMSGVSPSWSAPGITSLRSVSGILWLMVLLSVSLWFARGPNSAIRRLGKGSGSDQPSPKPTFGTGVEQLSLSGTSVTDADLENMAQMTRLRVLWLSDTKITDAGLKQVGSVASLEELALDGTRVTDAGLKELHGLKKLKQVLLRATQVTDAGIAALKGALPELQVEF